MNPKPCWRNFSYKVCMNNNDYVLTLCQLLWEQKILQKVDITKAYLELTLQKESGNQQVRARGRTDSGER